MLSVVVYSMAAVNLALTPAFFLGPYLLPLSVEVALKGYGIHLSSMSPGFAFIAGSMVMFMSVVGAAGYSCRRQVAAECLESMGKLRTYICVGILGVAVPVAILVALSGSMFGLIFMGESLDPTW